MIKYIYLILFIPILLLSQDDLRIETIDVVKEYDPSIVLGKKISSQPTFNDTLSNEVTYSSKIMNLKLLLNEFISFDDPVRLRLKTQDQYNANLFTINVGNNSFLKTELKYSNGLSLKHNSGLLISLNSDEMRFGEPYFKDLDGSIVNSIKLYTNRFFNTKSLKIMVSGFSKYGLYWGGLDSYPLINISHYKGNNLSLNIHLNESSNESFLDFFNIKSSYFYNNHSRSEAIITTSISLKREKSLKKQLFIFDLMAVHTSINNTSPNDIFNMSMVNFLDLTGGSVTMTDMLLKNQFKYQGSSFLDYHFGYNIQYFRSHDNNSTWLVSPDIYLSKLFSTNKSASFRLSNQLVYHSFTNMFIDLPYIDPYYSNSLSREAIVALRGNLKINSVVSFFTNLKYIHNRDFLLPFLFDRRSLEIANSTHYLNPINFVKDDVSGFVLSPSFSFNFNKCNILIQADFSSVKASSYASVNVFPGLKFNMIFNIPLSEKITLLSDLIFINSREVLVLNTFSSDFDTAFVQYDMLDSSINSNVSVNYSFSNLIFSLEVRNLLSNKIHFYDGYYENDGRQLRVNFIYKF